MLQRWFSVFSSWKKFLILFLMTQAVYFSMLLISIPNVMQHASGMKIPDLLPFGYDTRYIDVLFNRLGEEGRRVYLLQQIPLDMVYPMLFAITYSMLLLLLYGQISVKHNNFKLFICFLPYVAGVFDYLENIGMIVLLRGYPDIYKPIVVASSVCSILKSMLGITVFSFVFILLLIVLFFKIKQNFLKKRVG